MNNIVIKHSYYWDDSEKESSIEDIILDAAEGSDYNYNDLSRANIRGQKIAKTIDNLISTLHSKGILTPEEVLSILPIYNGDNKYKIS